MIQIVPAILATTEDEYREQLHKIESSNLGYGWVHIDFMDNKFVQNKSVDFEVLEKFPTNLNIEAHLMVNEPNLWITPLKEAGVKRIIAHIEVDIDTLDDFISSCKVYDIEVGLAIKMDTPLEKLEPYWQVIDLVLIMSIEPGFQGQPFIPQSIDRIKEVKEISRSFDRPFLIGVDGHINDTDAKKIVEAGANHLVVGSYLLKGRLDENLKIFQKALKS